MAIYYDEECDVLCIVEGDKIWKFVGEFAPSVVQKSCLEFNEWFEAKVHPASWHGYEFIGEIK